MARDDYFVVVYKILKYLYECLKSGEKADIHNILTAETYGVNESYFDYIITELLEEGYIKGVSMINVMGRAALVAKIAPDITIKPKGIEYLQENSAIAKAKMFLKEIKETVPGLKILTKRCSLCGREYCELDNYCTKCGIELNENISR